MTDKRSKHERGLFNVGLEAALKYPKSKLWAKVNSSDNFYWAVRTIIHDAILDDVVLILDKNDTEWLNDVCRDNEKKLKEFISKIAAEAYIKLNEK